MKKFIAGAVVAALTSAFSATSVKMGDAVELTFEHDGGTVAFKATVASVAESDGVTTTSLSSGGTICGTILEMADGATITSWRDVESGLNYSSVKGASGEVKTHVSEATLHCAHCEGGCEECSAASVKSVSTMSTLSSGITVQSNDPYPDRVAVTPDYSTTIDVLFVFDTTAQTYASNNGYSLESFARAAIANCNTILSNSKVTSFTYKYAGSIGVNVTEAGVSGGLGAITESGAGGSTDSVYYPAWQLRNSTAADVVCYLVGTTGTGESSEAEAGGGNGLAWLLSSTDLYDNNYFWRYCCCEIGGGVNSYVIPHEIGHVLGLGHGRGYSNGSFTDGDSGIRTYARGYGFKYHSNRKSTIMSGAGTKIPYYSNPSEWVPEAIPGYTETETYYLGEADKFDAARSLSETANACTLWGVPMWTDEEGTVPQVWLPFNGNYGNHGSSRVASFANPISEAAWTGSNEPYYYLSGDAVSNATMYTSSCRLASEGDKALVIADGVAPYGTITNGGYFTVMTTMRSIATSNAVMFCVGKRAGNGFALVSGGYGSVKLVRHDGDAAYTDLVTASVPTATTHFHHYAVTYANPTVTLYVDGTAVGSNSSLGSLGSRDFQIGNMHGGSGSTGLVRGNGVVVDDWRYYSGAMASDSISTYAAANPPWGDGSVVDEQGIPIAHWYAFNSGLRGAGAADDCFEGETNMTSYAENAETTAHGKAMVTVNNSLHPYGTLTNASEFAVSLFLKSVTTEDAVLFCLGNTDAAGIALLAGGTDAVKFYTHSSSTKGSSSTTAVANATEQYHHYVLNYTGGKYYLYVDGALAKSTGNVDMTFTVDQSNRKFQLGGMHGGVGSHGITRVSGVAIDDFRVYPAALTAEQIATMATHFPVWPLKAKPVSDSDGMAFGYYFNGGTDGSWARLGNWSRNAEYTNSVAELVLTSGNVPATTDSNIWDPLMFDGALMTNLVAGTDGRKHVTSPESTSSGQQIEGWELKLMLTNSVRVTIGKLSKIQSTTKIVVDETSRLEVNGYAGGNVNDDHWFHIFAPSGMVFNTVLNGNTQSSAGNMYYELGAKGSVQYGALSGRAMPHGVKSLTLDLGDTNLTGKAVISRKLIGFTSNSGHTFNADGVSVGSTVMSITPASAESVSDSNDVGSYCFSVKDDGYYVDYVAYAASQTIELNINLEGETESAVTANAEAVALLLAKDDVTTDNINSLASNGLRVWQNAMLGITPPDTTTEDIEISISMVDGSPVVSATTSGLSELGLSTSDPQKTITCGNIIATVTLQQATTPNPASWSTADTTSADSRFYRVEVKFSDAK
ncbi:MAG: hypothetical protein K6F50_07515 [Kiritimatiellae bacterium]|nr:hypothetical protein [Kiritimatiellia bacterium]